VAKIFFIPLKPPSFRPVIVDFIRLKKSQKVVWVADQIRPGFETEKFDFRINFKKKADLGQK